MYNAFLVETEWCWLQTIYFSKKKEIAYATICSGKTFLRNAIQLKAKNRKIDGCP